MMKLLAVKRIPESMARITPGKEDIINESQTRQRNTSKFYLPKMLLKLHTLAEASPFTLELPPFSGF